MAWTIAVARPGQDRSLTRIFQVLSVAIARSARARIADKGISTCQATGATTAGAESARPAQPLRGNRPFRAPLRGYLFH